jgi:D-lactate dehydrogenase
MRIAVFQAKNYERRLLDELNPRHKHEIVYFEPLLGPDTAVLAAGSPAVAVFVNDQVDADVIK